MGLHQERTHPEPVEGCFGCKVQEIDILGYDRPRESGWVARDKQKAWDKELAAYKDARRQGVQPMGTQRKQVEQAMKISDKAGKAFNAGRGTFE